MKFRHYVAQGHSSATQCVRNRFFKPEAVLSCFVKTPIHRDESASALLITASGKHFPTMTLALCLLGLIGCTSKGEELAVVKETIGGGTIETKAEGPPPSFNIGGTDFVLVKNWDFG